MNRLIPFVTLLGALLLQVGLVPYIAVGGVTPNILLLAALTVALVKGPRSGMTAGFVAGVLFDVLGTAPIGAAALVFCLAAYVAGSIQQNTFAEGWLVPLVVVFVATFLAEAGYMLVLTVLGEGGPGLGGVFGRALPAAFYNAALAVLFYPWVARFLRREKPMTTFGRIA